MVLVILATQRKNIMYVYVDLFFLLNMGMNTLVFILTAKAAGYDWRWLRVLTAAAAGGLYAIGAVIPALSFLYGWPVMFCVAALLLFIVFGRQPLRRFIHLYSLFLLVSFVLGGAVTGWFFASDGGQWMVHGATWSVSWKHVLAGSLLAVFLIAFTMKTTLMRARQKRFLYSVTIGYRMREVTVTALLDSGNSLLSPLSRRPVLLVEQRRLLPVLGEDVCRFLSSMPASSWFSELTACSDHLWLERVEPILYQSVGNRNMLIGFRPDCVIVENETGEKIPVTAMVGIYNGSFSDDGSYSALLHPLLLEGRDSIGGRERANQVANF